MTLPSVDPATSAGPPAVTAGAAWELSPSVALRPEPFGALAYDFVTRRLSFLKSPALVDVVRGLAAAPDVDAALCAAGVPPTDRGRYVAALTTLAASGIIRERTVS